VKILVTGAAGFIGSHLTDRLVESGHDVIALDDLSMGERARVRDGVPLHVLDIRSPAAAALIAAEKPQVVFHQAAQVDVRKSVEDPVFDIQVNVEGTLRLALAAHAAGARRFIFASSGGAIYGDTSRIPTPEDERTEPTSPYGCSKLAAERYLETLKRMSAMDIFNLRYGNVYGPRQSGRGEAGVVSIFMRRLLAGEECHIHGDGNQTRDFVYVDDVVEANLLALESRTAGTYNVGTGVETSINDLYALIAWCMSTKKTATHLAAKAGEQMRSVLDCSRAQRVLAWAPRIAVEEGLKRTLDAMRAES
jgi:UDP-glucose 4-epimerase